MESSEDEALRTRVHESHLPVTSGKVKVSSWDYPATIVTSLGSKGTERGTSSRLEQ